MVQNVDNSIDMLDSIVRQVRKVSVPQHHLPKDSEKRFWDYNWERVQRDLDHLIHDTPSAPELCLRGREVRRWKAHIGIEMRSSARLPADGGEKRIGAIASRPVTAIPAIPLRSCESVTDLPSGGLQSG